MLAARGETPAAFGRRCLPADCVAPPSNIPDILGRRALSAGRLAALGATPDFHHGLLTHWMPLDRLAPFILVVALSGAVGFAQSTPITFVQHAGADAGATTSASLPFPAGNTAGNWIAVVIRAGQTGQTFTVSDTRGDTDRPAVQFNETGD